MATRVKYIYYRLAVKYQHCWQVDEPLELNRKLFVCLYCLDYSTSVELVRAGTFILDPQELNQITGTSLSIT